MKKNANSSLKVVGGKLKHSDIEVVKIKFDGSLLEPRVLIWKEYKSFDYIIHAAGYGQPQMFGRDKIKTISVNTKFTDTLFVDYLKPKGSFLFISTSEVYSGTPSPHTEDMIGTTTPQHPRACYIEGKRCGESICMAYKEQGYDVKIARLALAYGEGTKKGDTRVLNQLIEQALTQGEIKLLDNGEAERTYCYVGDVAEMLLDILFKGKDVVYNVGGVSKVTIKELAEWIGEITKTDVILGTEIMEGSPHSVELDISKITTEFPRKFTELDVGLTKTINYQKMLYGKE